MTATGTSTAPDVVDVVALGESMVAFLPSRPGRLADVPSFDRGIGGAESNVACVLAAAGHPTRWVSRVGEDGFGDHLVEAIGAYGVDVTAVPRDPARPTGVYFRTAGDRATDAHEVAYYRAGSAASAMAVENVDLRAVRAGRVLHLSGITAALSDECSGLLWWLTAPRPERPLVSFDVNFRPGLWRDAEGPRVLLDLARRADVVFVGTDEARAAWGVTGGPEAIRALLPEPPVLVVKEGARGATVFERADEHVDRPSRPAAGAAEAARVGAGGTPQEPGRATDPRPARTPGADEKPPAFVPAPHVTVAAAVGAGDAFAAGFLSATLRGLPVRDRLRHGHLWAAAALTVPGDLATPPPRDHADRLAALDDGAWGRLRLGPGWTHAVDRASEEVRTP
ncbi:sugar kinase [Streptomyces chromofuscus]|uniref:Sugar kinase n=1 Tax=Streptomyces chromofuscus TaxID=42881 RepID=A0A7M2T3B5_STRCW|nr:sugar kinase [Streptomyces chromofuscus]QOV42669.1 sugar kinase [Streptomyces chromofuscus]GGS89814.1 carbohydrate kinase [Streptomyces chromofuscus]